MEAQRVLAALECSKCFGPGTYRQITLHWSPVKAFSQRIDPERLTEATDGLFVPKRSRIESNHGYSAGAHALREGKRLVEQCVPKVISGRIIRCTRQFRRRLISKRSLRRCYLPDALTHTKHQPNEYRYRSAS